MRPAAESPELSTVSNAGSDVEIGVWQWPGEDPPLLFAHATSFHGRCWDRIIRTLPGRRAIALDFRGHGRSSKPAPPYRWRAFASDLVCVAERLGLSGAVGVGHSMGGYSTALAAAARPQTFAKLLLIDPTIFTPETYGGPSLDAPFILRRRAHWTSPEEMFQRFQAKAPFAAWKPEVLRDYCEFGLLPNGNGFALACPPEVEASIYANGNKPEANPYPEISSITQPVVVMRAGMARRPGHLDLAASPTAPDLASRFQHGRDIALEGRSHYIPMECPEEVAAQIRQLW